MLGKLNRDHRREKAAAKIKIKNDRSSSSCRTLHVQGPSCHHVATPPNRQAEVVLPWRKQRPGGHLSQKGWAPLAHCMDRALPQHYCGYLCQQIFNALCSLFCTNRKSFKQIMKTESNYNRFLRFLWYLSFSDGLQSHLHHYSDIF